MGKCISKDVVLGKSHVAKGKTTPEGDLGKDCKTRSSSRKIEGNGEKRDKQKGIHGDRSSTLQFGT